MSLLRSLRAKGHDAHIREDYTLVVELAAGADADKAEAWAKKHENELRCEVVSEMQRVAGVLGVFPDARVRKVKGHDGEEIKGRYEVRAQADQRASELGCGSPAVVDPKAEA